LSRHLILLPTVIITILLLFVRIASNNILRHLRRGVVEVGGRLIVCQEDGVVMTDCAAFAEAIGFVGANYHCPKGPTGE